MGLLTNRVDKDSLKPGDHIYSWRKARIYAHHGIYIGDDRVVHYTAQGEEMRTGTRPLGSFVVSSGSSKHYVPCPTCIPSEDGHGVVSTCLNCFLAGRDLYRFEYSVSFAHFIAKGLRRTCTRADSDPADEVVQRAKYLLDNGFGCYNLVKNNCEHFAVYCKTGLRGLDQITVGIGQGGFVRIWVEIAGSVAGVKSRR